MRSLNRFTGRWATVLAWISMTAVLTAATAPALTNFHRVLFLGDSITYSGQYVEWIEAGWRLACPTQALEVINAGLPSETVSGLSEPGHAGGKFPRPDLHERLARVLKQIRPGLVFACYGMNDGIYHPFSEERFGQFQQGITWLRTNLAATGATLVLLTPPVFDPRPIASRTLPAGRAAYPQPFAGYDEVLDRYSEWLLARRADGWLVVDIHGAMHRALRQGAQGNPDFSFATDGIHPNEAGHWVMAQAVLREWGNPPGAAGATNGLAMLAGHARGGDLLKLVQQRQRLEKDAWLTATGHQRPGMNRGKPLAEAEVEALALNRQIEQLLLPGAR